MGVAASPTRIGDFELLLKLGEGGMGAVYKARMISQDRICALKVLPPKAAEDAEYLNRFLREARATAKLNHPNIVRAYAVGSADGYHVFAMELVEGTNLKQRIKGLQRLSEDEVVVIGTAIASALAHAHDKGIIHRDVKPENILMDAHGTPKLSDLGLVHVHGDGTLTQAGFAVGTPHYMSPEQSRGDKEVDGRSDIYSLGCTLYHAATGSTPFDGPTPAVLMLKHINEKMPHPQDVNRELTDDFCRVIDRMVARKKEDRYANFHEVHDDLARLLEGEPPQCEPLSSSRSNFIHDTVATTRVSQRPVTRPSTTRSREIAKVDPKKKPNHTWMIAGIATGALLAIAILIKLLSGSAEPAKTEKPTTKPADTAPKPKTDAATPPRPQLATKPEAELLPAVPLFNGRDLAGWRVMDPKWSVENGEMVGVGVDGNAYMLCTQKIPSDFELTFSMKVNPKGSSHMTWNNAGSLISTVLRLEWNREVVLERFDGTGSTGTISRQLKDKSDAYKFRIVQQGAQVKLFVDDQQVMTYNGEAGNGSARVLYVFSHRNSEVRINDMKVRELKQ